MNSLKFFREKSVTTNIYKTVSFATQYHLKTLMRCNRHETAKWTREQLQNLGPTYIKIGQFMSTRSDIFDSVLVEELKLLQNNVNPVDGNLIRDIIEAELHAKIEDVFAEFDNIPLACASVSQVHKARLKSTGDYVVIKVQRPSIVDDFKNDFEALNTILNTLQFTNIKSIKDSKMLIDQCYDYLMDEIKFENEIDNIQLYLSFMGEYPQFVVPRPYKDLCTSRVLTLSYVESQNIFSISDVSLRKDLATSLMTFFLDQVLNHGVVHADPHPGNMGYDGKQIVLYDFGQVAKLDSAILDHVNDLLFSLYEKDVDMLTKLLIKSGSIYASNSSDVKPFIYKFLKYIENLDIDQLKLSLLESDELQDVPFTVNPKLVMVFRSLSLLEGVCKELDQTFSYYQVIDAMVTNIRFGVEYIEYRCKKDITWLTSQDEPDSVSLKPNPKERVRFKYELNIPVILGLALVDYRLAILFCFYTLTTE